MAETTLHPLSSALGLALPTDAGVRAAPQGLAAEHPAQGWRLTAFQRPATPGASAAQLHAAVLGSLAKRYPEGSVAVPAAAVTGASWQGLSSVLALPEGRRIRVLTVVEPTADPPLLLAVVLDAARDGLPAALPAAWLQPLAAVASPVAGLSLAPMESDAPAPAPARVSLSLAPMESDAPAPTPARVSLSLAPMESDAPAKAAPTLALVEPEAAAAPVAAPEAARARFGAREPSAGPVAADLRPASTLGPPPMPSVNPYQPPDTVALEADTEVDPEALKSAGRGQQILIWCVLLNFAVRGIHRNPEVPMFLSWAIAVALMAWAFHGVLLIASGFGYGRGAKLGLMFGSTVPLLGIGLWIWLSMKTTRALKAAGYTVGFFGVKS
jgi:hypothetical protein